MPTSQPFSILVVDDEPSNFEVIETLLSIEETALGETQAYQLHYVANGATAVESLELFQPDVILLDVMMPGMSGLEVCQRIKAMPQWRLLPIIMVTSLTDKADLARCFAAGADDFISKPVTGLELNARVRSMLRIRRQYQALANFNNRLEKTVQERTTQLQTMITQDGLTQLSSRAFLLQQIAEMLRAQCFSFAVVYLDCDQFKLVNSAFGHGVGNQLLLAIAGRLQQLLRPGDTLARVGEDEFCFLLHQIDSERALQPFIDQVLQSFVSSFEVDNCEIFMTACIGIALGNWAYQQAEEPLQDADTAMYKAKQRGKNVCQVFDRQMSVAMLKRLTLETDLQRALNHQEFVAYYQPIVNLHTEALCGFEALVRWQHPSRGLVSPNEFIPCMEETGLIVPLGIVVLHQACGQLLAWHQQGHTDLTMSVNLSVRQFASPTLLADIDQVLAETGLNPAYLKLEITESALLENAETAIGIMAQLRSRQIHISVDDFGTGYSSLSSLHRFPLCDLKIDRSFVSQMHESQRNFKIVSTIISLGDQLGLTVVAEGIETRQQLEHLLHLGCQLGQGYLFNQPLSANIVEIDCLNRRL
ncbi:EAL domain-containing protein [Leptolyngbya sp. CCNP1308]|uniref:two-component system response regulator n=1 Tax=Leptolyngbya sp. CCNP1308 TaxID=3110255 RepID=UPI002B20379F|nr:EAL domain-containing protein [Leptolyngbya sp. CCNP1308]MEA5452447.1 EAL domain-containing protein [Leptolyngbya sp. CCNP1308]